MTHSSSPTFRFARRSRGPRGTRFIGSIDRLPIAAVVCAALLGGLLGAGVGAPRAAAQAVLSLSPDVTIPLGPADLGTADHAVVVDNQLGVLVLENLGSIPSATDLVAYAAEASGARLLAFDTTVSLSGGLVARPGDVVRRSGTTHSIAFSAAAAGLPPGVQVDAVAASSPGVLLLSFDTAVSLPGSLHVADEDLVRWNGSAFSLALDGSAAGLSSAYDVDAVDDLGPTTFLLSFDTAGSVGSITFADEDVVRHASGVWTLERDGSVADADWGPADLDAMQMVPEPASGVTIAAGLGLLASIARARGRGRGLRAARRARPPAAELRSAAIAFAGIAGLLVLGAASAAPAADGTLEIHQTCAVTGGCFPGDTAGFPVTISAAGSYRLTSNLTMPNEFQFGIEISASNVSVDLNGFAIVGTVVCSGIPVVCTPATTGGGGIRNSADTRSTKVSNGTIRGLGGAGINLGRASTVTNVVVLANRGMGIDVGADSVVIGNVVAENSGTGISVGGGTVVRDNVSARNGVDGVADGADVARVNGVLVSNNSLYQNGANGVDLGEEASVVTGNTVYDNTTNGVVVADGSTVNANAIVSSGDLGLTNVASEIVSYTDNVLTGNTDGNVEVNSGLIELGGNSCGGTATCP